MHLFKTQYNYWKFRNECSYFVHNLLRFNTSIPHSKLRNVFSYLSNSSNSSPNIVFMSSTMAPILPLLHTTTDCVLSPSRKDGSILKCKYVHMLLCTYNFCLRIKKNVFYSHLLATSCICCVVTSAMLTVNCLLYLLSAPLL